MIGVSLRSGLSRSSRRRQAISFLDLVVVRDLGEGDAALVLDRVLQSLVEAVEEALWV